MLVEGDTLLRGSCLGSSDGNTEDGVSTEFALVGGAVELDQEVINLLLLGDLELRLDELGADDVVDVRDGLQDACGARGRGFRANRGGRRGAYIPLPTYCDLSPSRSSTAS